LMLMFVIILFTEGRPMSEEGVEDLTKTWLMYLYGLSGVGAFTFYLLSIWLSIHASVAAHSFGVRMLTQFVRLPVPDQKKLDKTGRFTNRDYEQSGAGTMFRVPIVRQQLARFNAAMGDLTASDSELKRLASEINKDGDEDPTTPVGLLKHVQLYRQLQANWQAYDAYARVCMSLGTNQMVMNTAYYILELLIVEQYGLEVAVAVVLILGLCAWLIARLDMYVSRRSLATLLFLNVSGPLLTAIVLGIDQTVAPKELKENAVKVVIPFVFIIHLVWMLLMVQFATPEQDERIALPVKFRSVLYLDVFGWLDYKKNGLSKGNTVADFGREPGLRVEGAELPAVVEEQDDMIARVVSNGQLGSVSELVRSAAGNSRRFGPATTDASMPENLRISLGRDTKKLQLELKREIVCWEVDQVQALLKDDPHGQLALRTLAALRQQFNESCTEFFGESDPEPSRQSDELPRHDKIWLSLQWQVNGELWQYFYDTSNGDIAWEHDKVGKISCVNDLVSGVQTFKQNVRILGERLAVLPSGVNIPSHPSSSSVNSDSSAQQQFGGREAVRIEPEAGEQRPGFAVNATVGETFHPHRENISTVKRPPGQMPWRIFWQASMLIVSMWIVGLAFVLIEVVGGYHIPGFYNRPAEHEEEHHEETLDLKLSYSGPWPHSFFDPTGVACNSVLGSKLLISEKYAVHQLDVAKQTLEPALVECLAEVPEFQSGGISAISLDCANGSPTCFAVLFGADGQSALNCSFSNGTSRLESQIWTHGKWKARAAGSGSMWGFTMQAPVQFDRRVGADHEMVPGLQLSHHQHPISSVAQLQVVGDDHLFVLDKRGKLLSWPLKNDASHSWWLPTDTKWSGVCGIQDTLFFAHARSAGKSSRLWSVSRNQFQK